VGGLGPAHLVTYVVVGAHVQLVHSASVLFHLWVLPATYGMNLKEQLLDILCLQFIFEHYFILLETFRSRFGNFATAWLTNFPKKRHWQGVDFVIKK
jgi:hypothetical protein